MTAPGVRRAYIHQTFSTIQYVQDTSPVSLGFHSTHMAPAGLLKCTAMLTEVTTHIRKTDQWKRQTVPEGQFRGSCFLEHHIQIIGRLLRVFAISLFF